MNSGMARDLYRRCKYVVYGRYGTPIGNYVITCEHFLPLLAIHFNLLFFKIEDQNCHSNYTYDGVQELKLQ